MAPLLSIVTVTKNCDTTIGRTLESVKKIKTPEIEYIIVDGLSDDNTLSIVQQHREIVNTLISENDSGIYNAMNKGIALARGKYVLFINGDDELVADGFPEVLQKLQGGQADILCATTLVGSVDAPSEILVAKPWHLLFFNSIPHPSTFVATSLLRKYRFREDLRIASDYNFFLQAYLLRQNFIVVPAVTALHQRGGASGNTQRSFAEVDRIRREQLGWSYLIANGMIHLYRFLKLIFRRT